MVWKGRKLGCQKKSVVEVRFRIKAALFTHNKTSETMELTSKTVSKFKPRNSLPPLKMKPKRVSVLCGECQHLLFSL